MKTKRHISLVFLVLITCMLLVLPVFLSGCRKAAEDSNGWDSHEFEASFADIGYSYDADFYDADFYNTEMTRMALRNVGEAEDSSPSYYAAETTAATSTTTNRIIRSAEITLSTTEYDATIQAIEALTREYGGFIQDSSIQGQTHASDPDSETRSARDLRTASYTIRIPQERFDDFISRTDGIAAVEYRHIWGEDITDRYFDTAGRVAMYRVQEERILEIMRSTHHVNELLQLEDRLSRVRQNIEALTGTLRRYDAAVSFSTVEIQINERLSLDEPEPSEPLFSRLGTTLSNSISALGSILSGLLIILVAVAPFLVLLAVVGIPVLLVLRRMKRKKVADNKDVHTTNEA